MIYLYIKRLPTGLFYLGKTEQDPNAYIGSGNNWLKEIKKNNFTIKDIETWILHKTESKEEIVKLGRYYSNLFSVVESENWANLKEEEGDGGATNKGKIVINNEHNEKFIKIEELDYYLSMGWKKGITLDHIKKSTKSKIENGSYEIGAKKMVITRINNGSYKGSGKKAAITKKLTGIDKIASKKASETKKKQGIGKIAALKAVRTKRETGTLDLMYKKIAETRKANGTNKINGSDKKKRIILQYDLNNNLIREWSSVNEARDFCGGAPHKAASGKQKQSNGFIWKWKN